MALLFFARFMVHFISDHSGVRALVIDGDTIKWYNEKQVWERMRLFEMDAPEKGQMCQLGQEEWACGLAAALKLQQILYEKGGEGKKIVCTRVKEDRFGRSLATCFACDPNHPKFPLGVSCIDIGAQMVKEGFAVAFSTIEIQTQSYAEQEAYAQQHNLGMWAGSFERPEQWRLRRREGLGDSYSKEAEEKRADERVS